MNFQEKDIDLSLFVISSLTAFLLVTLPLFASNSETSEPEQLQETKEFFLTETEEGQKKWDIKAASAEFSSEGLVRLKDVKINLYDKEKKVLDVKADSGYFSNVDKTVHLEGNVMGATDRGENFSTQKLDWIASEKKIITNDKVKVTSQNLIINAQGVEILPELKKIIFKKNIKAEVYGGNKTFPLKLERD